MATKKVLLDKRIHRSIAVSVTTEVDLSTDPNFKVLLKATGGVDSMTISRADGTLLGTVKCVSTFIPPKCGTKIASRLNPSVQVMTSLDDRAHRVLELEQNLCDPADAVLLIKSFTTADPDVTKDILNFRMADDGGPINQIPILSKIPPKVGEL